MNTHQITTRDERRAALWEGVFGTDTLPVLHDAPRWQEQQGREFATLAYDLDTMRLTSMQRARFASHLARVERRPYLECVAEINSGKTYMIKASSDIEVLEPAEQQAPLASLLPDWAEITGRLLRQRALLWRRLARV